MVGYDQELQRRGGVTIPPRNAKNASFSSIDKARGEHGHPIEFTHELGLTLLYLSTRFIENFDVNMSIPMQLPPECEGELRRFWCGLKSYHESTNPIIPLADLLQGLLEGHEYITFLKKLRSYHVVISRGGRFDEEDPDLDRVRAYSAGLPRLIDLGQIFNVRYYFFWSSPDEKDWQYCFKELKEIAPQDLQDIEDTVFSMLPDDVTVIHEEEILLQMSGSSSLTKDGGSSKVFVEKDSENYFSKAELRGRGSYIQKCPGDTRYSITLSLPQSNTIKLIEKQVALIAAEVPYSCYTPDDAEFFKRFHKFGKNNTCFYNRDVKKDGLTKPRPLLRAVCAAIAKKYPHLPCVKYFSIYDGFALIIDGMTHYPPRGVGLGMSSALTTILQAAQFIITRREMIDLYETFGQMSALIYHDDITIGSEDEPTLEDYADHEEIVLQRHGIIKNKRKSSFTDFFVLCENYSDERLDEKESYQRYMLNLPLAAVNICHAKMEFGSNLRFIHSVDWAPYLEELVAFWGYEYFNTEAEAPAQWGGWVPAYYQQIDISLYLRPASRLEKAAALSFTLEKPAAFHQLKNFSEEPFRPPCEQLWGKLEYAGQEKPYYANTTFRGIARRFMDMKSIGAKNGYWSYVRKKRMETFTNLMRVPEPDDLLFYRAYVALRPLDDIIPPVCLYTSVDILQFPEVTDLYRPAEPFIQYLKFHNLDKLPDTIIPWPIPPGVNFGLRQKFTAEERKQLQISPEILKAYNIGELKMFDLPERLIMSDQWFNPNQVRAAIVALTGRDELPVGIVRKSLSFVGSIDRERYLNLSIPGGRVLNYLANRRGYQVIDKLGGHLLTFYSELWPFVESKMRAKEILARNLEILDGESWSDFSQRTSLNWSKLSDSPLADEDFFIWQNSHKLYKDWRNRYFWSMETKLGGVGLMTNTHLGKSAVERGLVWGDQHVFTSVERHLWLASGGKLNEFGIPLLDGGSDGSLITVNSPLNDGEAIDSGYDPWADDAVSDGGFDLG